ncbi:MAG: prepilin-type N-terminal cleavage/methylation domain-containing protein [Candidatus Omnitrophota bacterium]
MLRSKSFTLMELVIAMVLISILIVIASASWSSFHKLKNQVLNDQDSLVKGHMITAAIFERILRSGQVGDKAASYNITDGNTSIRYKIFGVDQRMWLDSATGQLRYSDGSNEKVLANNIKSINFFKSSKDRLGVEVTLANNETFRTCVQPRNKITAASVIN